MESCDRIFNVIIICNGLAEFRDFCGHRRKKLAADSMISLGSLVRMYVGAYTKNKSEWHKYCYIFHYESPGPAHKVNTISVDSWEAWGTGDNRIDFEIVVTMCKNRWNAMHPTTRRQHAEKPPYFRP